jgi:hypothetical protein
MGVSPCTALCSAYARTSPRHACTWSVRSATGAQLLSSAGTLIRVLAPPVKACAPQKFHPHRSGALSSERIERQSGVVEWGVEDISRPFYIPKWNVSTSKPDEGPAEWSGFFRSAVNLTMPRRTMARSSRPPPLLPSMRPQGSRGSRGVVPTHAAPRGARPLAFRLTLPHTGVPGAYGGTSPACVQDP